jgi:hypothetical protein
MTGAMPVVLRVHAAASHTGPSLRANSSTPQPSRGGGSPSGGWYRAPRGTTALRQP